MNKKYHFYVTADIFEYMNIVLIMKYTHKFWSSAIQHDKNKLVKKLLFL